MKKRPPRRSSPVTGLIAAIPASVGIGAAVWLFLLLVFALALSRADDPGRFVIPAVLVLAAVSAFAAGFAAGRLSRAGAVAAGLLTGAALLCVVWLISLVLGRDETVSSTLLKVAVGADFLLFSFLGAMFGMPRLKRRAGKRL